MAKSISPFDPDKHYLGLLCPKGHDWETTGQSRRFRSNGLCLECNRAHSRDVYYKKRMAAAVGQQLSLDIDGKTCSQCNTWKPYAEYAKQRATRDGYRSECKICLSAKNRAQKQRRLTLNPNYQEEARRHATEWRNANPQIVKKQRKAWKERNPERVSAMHARRYARSRGADGSHTALEWLAVCERQNHCCARCGGRKKLTRDHIVPLSKGGTNYIENIQGLCHSCNSSKRANTVDYRIMRE